jgi:hypothetical protein
MIDSLRDHQYRVIRDHDGEIGPSDPIIPVLAAPPRTAEPSQAEPKRHPENSTIAKDDPLISPDEFIVIGPVS